jgi:hypothetical protein
LYGFDRLNNQLTGLFMTKRDYFDFILGKVAEMTEISLEKMRKSNMEECVDARYLLVAILSERLSDRQIAQLGGWSVQLVNKAKNRFHERCRYRWGLKALYKDIHELSTNYPQTP